LDDAAVDRAWTRPVTVTGWHAASGLPKPEELCAVTGSTYRLSGPPERLRRLADRLQRDGIGLRRTEGFGDIDVVTGPWRPMVADTRSALESGAEAASLEWQRNIRDLGLSADLRRWVVGALRELQLHRARNAADTAGADWLAGELLARPAADEFSGRQRDKLRNLFAETSLDLLRDVTTLLAADLPPAGPGTE
jgi:CRISPR-associated protein Csx10